MKTLIAALLLGSTATPVLAQDAYSARGTEPFWSLTIGAQTMKFEAPGNRPIVVATPRVIHGFAGEIWQSRRISVNTVHRQCSDGMSDRTYRDTVTVSVDGRRYEGCGGGTVSSVPSPASLVEGDWRIELIDGRRPAYGTAPTVSFAGNRISGNAGCNRFNGSFDFAQGRLTAGPLATTRMACTSAPANRQETHLLRVLGERLTVSSNRAGKLVLTSRRGQTLTLARGGRPF